MVTCKTHPHGLCLTRHFDIRRGMMAQAQGDGLLGGKLAGWSVLRTMIHERKCRTHVEGMEVNHFSWAFVFFVAVS